MNGFFFVLFMFYSVIACVIFCFLGFQSTQLARQSARPDESCKNIQGLAPPRCPSKLVQLWYKTFPPDKRGLVEMKKPN